MTFTDFKMKTNHHRFVFIKNNLSNENVIDSNITTKKEESYYNWVASAMISSAPETKVKFRKMRQNLEQN